MQGCPQGKHLKTEPYRISVDRKNGSFSKKTDLINITCACGYKECRIFSYQMDVDRQKCEYESLDAQEAWLSFQYENASSNLLVWMQPQLFSFVTDSLLFVLHSRNGKNKHVVRLGNIRNYRSRSFFFNITEN